MQQRLPKKLGPPALGTAEGVASGHEESLKTRAESGRSERSSAILLGNDPDKETLR
jgi:hypothetical protein